MSHGRLGSLRRIGRTGCFGIGLCVVNFQVFAWLGVRINLSPSLPLGLYVRTSTGTLIEFCPSEPYASFSLLRGYRDSGTCPDGGAPLLKPIVAAAGDDVDFSTAGLTVNGTPLRNTAPLAVDTKGRSLQHWQFGRGKVASGTVWVASSYNARSFDSRYFGPVAESAIRSRLRPVLTF
jgi:conjugative transfer signal peptidase TraF